jgi:hypothetical protein
VSTEHFRDSGWIVSRSTDIAALDIFGFNSVNLKSDRIAGFSSVYLFVIRLDAPDSDGPYSAGDIGRLESDRITGFYGARHHLASQHSLRLIN